MTNEVQIIRKMAFFSRLSPETQEAVASCFVLRQHAANEIIQVAGEECRWIGFVHKGAVQVFKSSPNGREQVLQTLGPGMHFNAVPALDRVSRLLASIRALTSVELVLISSDDYRNLLSDYSDFSLAVLKDFGQRLENLTRLVEELSLHSVRERLARFLLDQADGGEISTLWTQDELAARLGTVRDVIGRTLRGFMDAGLIRREGSHLLLVDREKLEDVAKNG